MAEATLNKVSIEGLDIAYREQGSGPPVVLLHGWPTSSFLWRDVIQALAAENRVIAPDLPGFGASDKPLDRRYDFELFESVVDGLLAELEIERTGLAVHDIGGPIGVHWAIGNADRVTRLAILNTLLYPDFDPSVFEFVTALTTPNSRDHLTSPAGIEEIIRLGLHDETCLTEDALAGYQAPFGEADSRLALAAAGIQLNPEKFGEIAEGLPSLRMPVRIVCGEHDAILPDIADTVAKLERDLPDATATTLPVGHFLQEEAPEEVGELLAEFFAAEDAG